MLCHCHIYPTLNNTFLFFFFAKIKHLKDKIMKRKFPIKNNNIKLTQKEIKYLIIKFIKKYKKQLNILAQEKGREF